MTERAARAIAKTAHQGQQTSAGGSLFDHVQRVAAAVPKHARVTAWLHDILEHTDLTIGQLRAQGASSVELSALVLLTRSEHDDYRAYVERIADAPDPHGSLARLVKLSDLEDHLADSHCPSRSAPPYEWAPRAILLAHPQAANPTRNYESPHVYAANAMSPRRRRPGASISKPSQAASLTGVALRLPRAVSWPRCNRSLERREHPRPSNSVAIRVERRPRIDLDDGPRCDRARRP